MLACKLSCSRCSNCVAGLGAGLCALCPVQALVAAGSCVLHCAALCGIVHTTVAGPSSAETHAPYISTGAAVSINRNVHSCNARYAKGPSHIPVLSSST
mmetsp:Transcript_31194/g.79530  ORF Transcript_31194/g.79530 Transcript_31194/m.79530 type:complete len:99 (+) Transcript_31194:151-447(+)